MRWLIWKEFRLQRLVLAVGAVLLIAPYSIPIFSLLFNQPAQQVWRLASVMSLLLSIVTLALLGGNAIASERSDRSAEFLAYQPISRATIILHKLVLPLAALLVIWLPNTLIAGFTEGWHLKLLAAITVIQLAGFCALGVAWLVSCFQGSPTFAAASGIVAPFAVAGLVNLVIYLAGLPLVPAYAISFAIVAPIVGLTGFVGGTRYYVRRVEP